MSDDKLPGADLSGDGTTGDRESRVRSRAYALWESQGGGDGRHEDHWRQAEQEVDGAPDEGASPERDQEQHDEGQQPASPDKG